MWVVTGPRLHVSDGLDAAMRLGSFFGLRHLVRVVYTVVVSFCRFYLPFYLAAYCFTAETIDCEGGFLCYV